MIKVLTNRERSIFYATAGVIVFAVIFNFLIFPILTRNNSLNSEIKLNREKLAKYTWFLKNRDAIAKKYAEFIPTGTDSEATNVLSELENIAKTSGVKIIDLRPQQAGKIDMRAEGSMGNYIKFIYHLENSPVLLRIKKFKISTKSNSAVLEGIFSISQLLPD